jgi:hypothetical protein
MAGMQDHYTLGLLRFRVIHHHVINTARVPAGAQGLYQVLIRALLYQLLPVQAYRAAALKRSAIWQHAFFKIRFLHADKALALYAAHVPVLKNFQHIRNLTLLTVRVIRARQIRYNVYVMVGL